ncbi:uncharacterized protein LOC143554197 [Bidens hawaiensis]|uniref:uncharacterized protein LOC143554197 n=1 Tax=Bidens hawaiensis TaxID=980011 RepID=UPI00404B3013
MHIRSPHLLKAILCDDDDHDVASKRFGTVEFSRGRPGVISFFNQPYKKESDTVVSAITTTNQPNHFWFVGPAVLVASFVFPSLYTRKILSMVFEDPLLADLLILFFTEALFYCGVAMFLFIVDYLHGSNGPVNATSSPIPSPQLVYRATYVAALVFSLVMIPIVGLVVPWPGPLASGTPHNLATNTSLGMLLSVLQCLGLIYICSLSNYLMRILPSMTPMIKFMMPHTTKDKSWQAHVRSIIILLLSSLV